MSNETKIIVDEINSTSGKWITLKPGSEYINVYNEMNVSENMKIWAANMDRYLQFVDSGHRTAGFE